MTAKPETQFSQSFNNILIRVTGKPLPEKMSNLFRAGVPDFYIDLEDGRFGWFEYKWIDKPWKADRPAEKICSTKSWVQQHAWLRNRHNRGVKTGVIIGAPKLAAILLYPYNFYVDQHPFEQRKLVAKKLVKYLNED
jgi:hypothetical protein